MSNDNVVIKIAETQAEKLAAYRLRYDVFTREFNDDRYADHELQLFKDSDDVKESVLIIAIASGTVAGTVRLKPLPRREFIALERYQLSVLAKHLDIGIDLLRRKLGCLDRGVVKQEFRGRRLMGRLFSAGEEIASSLNLEYLIVPVEVNNIAAQRSHFRCGYRPYPVIGRHGTITCQCIYKVIGSPDESDVRD